MLKVPIMSGTHGLVHDGEMAVQAAEGIGFPVMLKTALGGGGVGFDYLKVGDFAAKLSAKTKPFCRDNPTMIFVGYILLTVISLSGLWFWAMLLCSIPWIQRQMLYLHNVPMWWGLQLNKPETLGFLKNQVTPLHISTDDGERLYAWLVTPLGVYAKNVSRFWEDAPAAFGDLSKLLAFRLLSEDRDARLIIYFHGNSATVAQPRRTEEYRMISSGASDKIFVLTFDYRGFGHSTGTPSEHGCINDAISVIKWASEEAKIAPERILLLAQSLGTAVASAAAHYFINLETPVQFAGVVLCAGFADTSTVFQSYSIGGLVPILAPLRAFPFLQAWFGRRIMDTWKTTERLADLVQKSNKIRLTLLHATSDNVIPWEQTAELFYRSVEASSELDLTRDEIDNKKVTIDLGEGGYIETWTSGNKIIQKEIVKHGGHDTIMKWGPVSLAVVRSFELLGSQ